MKLDEPRSSTNEVEHLLDEIGRKGVQLWCENGQLRYRGPRGALLSAEVDRIRSLRSELVKTLQSNEGRSDGAARADAGAPCPSRAPLAFTQLAYWHAYHLSDRASVRYLAVALRLRGRLDVFLLRRCLADIGARHAALRTRVEIDAAGEPLQVVEVSSGSELKVRDLSDLSLEAAERRIPQLIRELRFHPVQVDVGPLFVAELIKLGEEDHVLVAVAEHLIADARSMAVWAKEIVLTYERGLDKSASAVTPVPTHFPAYAMWQRSSQANWVRKHGEYWERRLGGQGRCRFPADLPAVEEAECIWATVPVNIDGVTKRELQAWCRGRFTTPVFAVLTAFSAAIMRGCEQSDFVLRYQTDGRIHPEIQNTIGYFAAVLHLRITLSPQDTLMDLLRRITDEYCAASEHADLGFIDTWRPQPGFTFNSSFNWVPYEAPESAAGGALEVTQFPFELTELGNYRKDGEPSILLFEARDGICGGVHYPAARCSSGSMERFVGLFLTLLNDLLTRPDQPVRDI